MTETRPVERAYIERIETTHVDGELDSEAIVYLNAHGRIVARLDRDTAGIHFTLNESTAMEYMTTPLAFQFANGLRQMAKKGPIIKP